MGAVAAAPTPQQIQAANGLARRAILQQGVEMTQQIFSQTYTASSGNISAVIPQINVTPRNVGLIKGFWVECTATVTNGSGVQIDRADFAPASLLSQIQYIDLQNNTRIQTTGTHLAMLNSIRHRRPFLTAFNETSFEGTSFATMKYGNYYSAIQAPALIAASGSGTVKMTYYVPLAYAHDDLRGAVYANVLQATQQLNFTPNPTPVVATATDSTGALYVGDASGSVALAVISSLTVTVYQEYWDQLPVSQGSVLLPPLDLGTVYEMKNTVLSAIVPNQEFPIPYANLRDFLSVMTIYVNTASTGARASGTDVNYWALQAANATNIWKIDPQLIAMKLRNHLTVDHPPGMNYFGSRNKPISTTQYGNMQLVMNPITAGTGAYMLLGFEDFSYLNTIRLGGSLAAN